MAQRGRVKSAAGAWAWVWLTRRRTRRRKVARSAPDILTSACSAPSSDRLGYGLRPPSAGPARDRPRTDSRRPRLRLTSLLPFPAFCTQPRRVPAPNYAPGTRLSSPHHSASRSSTRSARPLSEIPPNPLEQGHARADVTSPCPSQIRLLACPCAAREPES